jgi:hypothetical protein
MVERASCPHGQLIVGGHGRAHGIEDCMKSLVLAVAATLLAAPAYAQPPAPPECKDFPNGGKVFIDIPVVTGPTNCQACGAGFSVPSGFLLRYSNGHHDTCELKDLQGNNSGHCRADTTCPPGTTRTYQNNTLWVCQSGGGQKEITCPVPKIPDPPTSVTTPPAVATCIAQLKAAEGQLTTSAKGFVTAVADQHGGATPLSELGVQAAVAMSTTTLHYVGELVPRALRKKAACDIDRSNKIAVADCTRATNDHRTSTARQSELGSRFKDAVRSTKRAIGAVMKDTKTATKTRVDAATTALDTAVDAAEKTLDTCVAALTKIVP